MSTVTNRSEILFIYHVKDANPNGDPLDENKPRTDPDTGVATVTDVRIKRTIRDYWINNLGYDGTRDKDVLMRDTFTDDGYLKDGKGRARSFLADSEKEFKTVVEAEGVMRDAILGSCIDARVFGCTLPVEVKVKDGKGRARSDKGSVTLTGPVQFSGFNRSLHQVAPVFVQGTAGFASTATAKQKSFREDYLLPYACIACYGVINEIAAKTTKMTDDDAALVLEGLWRGTENLISRSKMGHQPLMLIHLEYRDNYRIGDLASRIVLNAKEGKSATELRDPSDFTIDASRLSAVIEKAERDNWVVSKSVVKDDALEVEGIDLSAFATLRIRGN